MFDIAIFIISFFIISLLYSTIGHGGASGYLAVMAITAMDPILFRSTALGLNIMVSAVGTILFFKAGFFKAKLFWPLVLAAVPCAYVGGSLDIQIAIFRKLLAITLCIALIRLFMPENKSDMNEHVQIWQLIVSGSVMGFVSGLIGVGGGIFLTPLIIFKRWGTTKTAAAISSPFIFLNSMAGLAGLKPSVSEFHYLFPWLVILVLLGGLIGSTWGSHVAASRQIRYLLGIVLSLAALKLFLT